MMLNEGIQFEVVMGKFFWEGLGEGEAAPWYFKNQPHSGPMARWGGVLMA